MPDAPRHRRTAALLVTFVLLLPTWSGEAHEIPADVTLQAFVRPEGRALTMLVRAPLEAMRDYDFPTREPGYLVVSEATDVAAEAAEMWVADYLTAFENGVSLGRPTVRAVRIARPGDRAFLTYERALENVRSDPLPDRVDLPPGQAVLDVLVEWPITSADSDFALESGLAHLGLRTVTVLRFIPAPGVERAFQFTGDPGRLRLDPRWYQAAWRFVVFGFEHILDGVDHILFLLCLVVPLRSVLALVPIVTAFTIAHSITLVAAALGLTPSALWFPTLIETLIALSIVFMAFENILGRPLRNRWAVAFGFGLVHGFGFSFALSESLQFAGAHLLASLLSFNIGVELGQLFVLVLVVPVLQLSFRTWLPPVTGVVVLSALLAHTGWHWMLARGADLLRFQPAIPVVDAGFLAALLRWATLGVVIGAAAWLLHGAFDHLNRRAVDKGASDGAVIVPGATGERTSI